MGVTVSETINKIMMGVTINETINKIMMGDTIIEAIIETITEPIIETIIETIIDQKTVSTTETIRTNKNSNTEGPAMIEEVDKMTVEIEKEEETNTETKTTTKEIEDPFPDPEAVMGIEMGTTIITNKGVTINHHQKNRLCKYRCKEP